MDKELLLYINKTPEIQSFLYDMDLLPEQLDEESFNWFRMGAIAMLIRHKNEENAELKELLKETVTVLTILNMGESKISQDNIARLIAKIKKPKPDKEPE